MESERRCTPGNRVTVEEFTRTPYTVYRGATSTAGLVFRGVSKNKGLAGEYPLTLMLVAETVSAGNVIQQSPFMNMDGS